MITLANHLKVKAYIISLLFLTQIDAFFFSPLNHLQLFSLSGRFFNTVSSNIDEVFSIKPFPNMFVVPAFNVDHKDWITYSY